MKALKVKVSCTKRFSKNIIRNIKMKDQIYLIAEFIAILHSELQDLSASIGTWFWNKDLKKEH